MANYTRAEITTIAKTLLDESSDDFWSTDQQEDLANMANKKVYRILTRVNPELFLSTKSWTWPGGSESITLTASDFFNEEPYKVLEVAETPSNSSPSTSNRAFQWIPIRFTERTKWNHHEWDKLAGTVSRGYVLQGDKMYVAPIPDSDQFIHVAWVPKLTELSAAGTEVLNGKAEMFGDAVCYCLAYLMDAKQEGQNKHVTELWYSAVKEMEGQARTRQLQRPRRVVSRRSR